MTELPEEDIAPTRAPGLPLSIDWEDWFQLCCPPFDAPDALDRYECRLPLATELVLALCQELGAHATWFCLADQAKRHPSLLRAIAGAGHEIALHGLDHRRAFNMDRNSFHAWVTQGKAVLEDISGSAIVGFRAPEWSLRLEAEDYWRELPPLGFRYDSSRAPIALLGQRNWPRSSYELAPGFMEFPPSVAGLGLATIPLWGWGMRLMPGFWLRRRLLEMAKRDAGTPLVLHPWELDEGQPLIPEAAFGHRFAHGAGLRNYGQRLRNLFRGIEFRPISKWIS